MTVINDDKSRDDILKTLVEDYGYDYPMDYLYYLTLSPYELQDDWNEVLALTLKEMNYPSSMTIKEYYDIKLLFTKIIQYCEDKLKRVLLGINIDTYFIYFYMLECVFKLPKISNIW